MAAMSLDQTKRPDDEIELAEAPPLPTLRLLFSKEEGILEQPPRWLEPGTLRLGRGVPAPEIRLSSDGQASREHAAVVFCRGQPPRLRDLGSSNGTFVNGSRISEVALTDGDVLRVGSTLLLFRQEPADLRSCADESIKSLVGQSPAMRRLRHEIALIAPSLATVLLLGDSGTGKEVTARALHERSGLKGPLVALNCAAIPESLAESQLFGHVGGAFTGAKEQPGCFRAAHGGTLFLDEIGELPAGLQPKLLRALEEGTITPVGAVTPLPCKVRLIAATNRDLAAAVAGGRMRGDLLARLAEIILRLPPLRERREDILPILRQALGEAAPPLSLRLAEALLLYGWPYNVRELLKVATELRVRGAGDKVLALELVKERLQPPTAASPDPRQQADGDAATAAPPPPPLPQRDEIIALLQKYHGKVSALALALRRSRTQVYRLLEQMEIDPEEFRPH